MTAWPDDDDLDPVNDFLNGFIDAATMIAKITARFNLLSPRVADSGWLTLALSSGYDAGSVAPVYRTIGPLLFVKGTFSKHTGSFGVSTDFDIVDPGTIPSAVCPVNNVNVEIAQAGATGSIAARASLGSNGGIHLYTGVSVPTLFDLSCFHGIALG